MYCDAESLILSIFFSVLVSGGVVLLFYKTFFESEVDLRRRLKSKQERYKRPKKHIRVWIDGCWDLFHFGHANAFRQARLLGDELFVGINTDKEIIKYKGGPPIMNEKEREIVVGACKWVDNVIPNCPYVMDEKYLNEVVFGKLNVDYVVHGDDPCLTPDGKDVFESVKKLGKFRTIKRTEGVSTTDIVGRMLLATTDHFRIHTQSMVRCSSVGKLDGLDQSEVEETDNQEKIDKIQMKVRKSIMMRPGFSHFSHFLPTARRIREFSTGKSPKFNDIVVYIDGGWDMFHSGHVKILEVAKSMGTFLIVGVHGDEVLHKKRGLNFPIMNLHERTLTLLNCSYIDDVIFGAPWVVTEDMIKSLKINIVAYGTVTDSNRDDEDPFIVPRTMGILRKITSSSSLRTYNVVERIINQRQAFEKKFAKKAHSETEYYKDKSYHQEI